MVCKQTTHFEKLVRIGILLPVLESRDCVTEYSAPQLGQKKVLPSGIAPVRGMLMPPNTEPNCQHRPARGWTKKGPRLAGVLGADFVSLARNDTAPMVGQ